MSTSADMRVGDTIELSDELSDDHVRGVVLKIHGTRYGYKHLYDIAFIGGEDIRTLSDFDIDAYDNVKIMNTNSDGVPNEDSLP